MVHFIEHILGLCGEKHLSLMAITEWPNFSLIFTYIKHGGLTNEVLKKFKNRKYHQS
jgi:hypothetical protein